MSQAGGRERRMARVVFPAPVRVSASVYIHGDIQASTR